ncbi:MAG: TIGR04282 family arsenosugar biosynthesis glycosyltransferase [Candidatus Eisenbacteria bacterium]|nr:TIGR04282 family arsenosugar biosynthesis glycosyltransferase [Candidatus Eisenbacteria bacterium]
MKTRLAAALGPVRAAELYGGFLADTLGLVTRLRLPASVFTTGGRLAGFRELAPAGTSWVPQGSGDLGARMRRAFAACFRAGARRVVMLGTDSPGLPARHVRAAFRALDRCDVVLGPALDGGYYLVGLDRPRPELLRGMPWGEPSLLEATARRARETGAGLALTDPWFDVDNARDLALLRDLAARGEFRPRPRHTLRILEKFARS